MLESVNLEKVENRQQVIQKWYDDKDDIVGKYNDKKISLKKKEPFN